MQELNTQAKLECDSGQEHNKEGFAATQDDSDIGVRLDVFVAKSNKQYSRAYAQNLIKSGDVLVNGKEQKPNYKIKAGDQVLISDKEPQNIDLIAQDIDLDIVYQDADIIVINKPQGMVVHPAAGNYTGTLVNALMFHVKDLAGISGEIRPGIVHRIDKDTSGLLVVAKNDLAHRSLAAQIKAHSARRTYVAIVEGNPNDSGVIHAPISRHKTNRKKMAVVEGGREAITHYRVIERYRDFALVECVLETGRTHQIRVHMASIHHAIAGDLVYGSAKPKLGLKAQALHAFKLGLTHPTTDERMTFCVDPPDNFIACVKKLRAQSNDIAADYFEFDHG